MAPMMYSVIIPVYRNAEYVNLLIHEFSQISERIQQDFGIRTEFVFVVDASPDNSYDLLAEALPSAPFPSQLVLHARNFGSFSAIRTGLQAARGDMFAVIAADLQEPPELLISFLRRLYDGSSDIVVGVRESRNDPAASQFSANLFWTLYRRWIVKDIPKGGVDIFGCNRRVRDELLQLREAHSSLVGLIFWLGFRRSEVGYERRKRTMGKSAWTFGKKLTYLLDSVFAFTDLPIRILTALGMVGLSVAFVLAAVVVLLRIFGDIEVPGYATTIVVLTFFGGLNTLGLGIVGAYAWRSYENTKSRPLAIIQNVQAFEGEGAHQRVEYRQA
jgi:polyisoprenyl-phosphate glycosyltransferase